MRPLFPRRKRPSEETPAAFPFPDAPDSAALTCCHVLEQHAPILHVSHDAEDGMWQCLCGQGHDLSQARLVSLAELYVLDPSIGQLAPLPRGCTADRRIPHAPWIIRP